MSKTLTTIQTSEYVLASGGNPLIIAGSGGVETNGGTAIYGNSTQAWTIANAGTVSGGSAAGSLGIDLRAGGAIGNTGQISGSHYGVRIDTAAGTVTNSGSITSAIDSVVLSAGGSVSNTALGVIYGAVNGLAMSGGGSVDNSGTIIGAGFHGYGVHLNGGLLTNQHSGTIVGGYNGVVTSGGTLINHGLIYGTGGISNGVEMTGGGLIINAADGTISGPNFNGITVYNASATIINAGVISGYIGVFLYHGGTITNSFGGVISGYRHAVQGYNGAVTVGNGGTIVATKAGSDAVALQSGFVNRVIVDPGAVFSGTVDGGNTIGAAVVSTLELASAASTGTLTGLGSTYIDFAQITVDPGASWTLSGSNTIVTGVTLTNTGTLTNAGVLLDDGKLTGGGTLINDGGISVAGSGSLLLTGGTATNAALGTIYGTYNGLAVSGGGSVVNAGTIIGAGFHGYGVYLKGGSLTNQHGGTIVGGYNGVVTAGGTLINHGLIYGTRGISNGVQALGGGLIVNAADGTISGPNFNGITAYNASPTIINAGVISGYIGVFLYHGGTITNSFGGVISGYRHAVQGYNGAVTVGNGGTIVATKAGSDAVALQSGFVNRVIVDPGAVFSGTVDGGNTVGASVISTLELASGVSTGTLTALGSQYVDFAQIIIDQGASWQLAGAQIDAGVTLTVDQATLDGGGNLLDNGTIVLDPSTMTVGSLTGTGSLTIGAGSTLLSQAAIGSSMTIAFDGTSGVLALDLPRSEAGVISGFAAGDTIELVGVSSVTELQLGHDDTLQIDLNNAAPIRLSLSGDFASETFQRTASGGNTFVTVDATFCFVIGTLIRTDRGEIPVERLAIGDRVVTLSGALKPIFWIGTGKTLATRGRRSAATPIIIRKGAFAANVPYQDLHVTKGHSFYFDEILVPGEFLVNHRSILWDDRAQEVTVYHVELETHDVLLANGAPAESYRDDGNRWQFQNANAGWSLPPKPPCAPVLTGGLAVDAIWRRLLDRSGSRPGVPLTDDPDVHLLIDGVRVDATTRVDGVYMFNAANAPAGIRIASNAAVPQEVGLARDPRRLGVAVRRIVARQGSRFRTVLANDTRLVEGFHALEADRRLRWTDGDAVLPAELFADFAGPFEVVVQVAGATQYVDATSASRRVA